MSSQALNRRKTGLGISSTLSIGRNSLIHYISAYHWIFVLLLKSTLNVNRTLQPACFHVPFIARNVHWTVLFLSKRGSTVHSKRFVQSFCVCYRVFLLNLSWNITSLLVGITLFIMFWALKNGIWTYVFKRSSARCMGTIQRRSVTFRMEHFLRHSKDLGEVLHADLLTSLSLTARTISSILNVVPACTRYDQCFSASTDPS